MAFGLPEAEALKGLTLYPAQLAGVAERLGSIEAGKEATLFAADADILDIMHVAPWAGTTGAAALPGIMRRLRGEWPCVPFGRTDVPSDLPAGWGTRTPDDNWGHGYAANHRWQCVTATPHCVHLAIDYPADAAVARIERTVAVDPHAPALDITLTIWSRRASRLPAGLHPALLQPDLL